MTDWCVFCQDERLDEQATMIGLNTDGQAHFACDHHADNLFDSLPLSLTSNLVENEREPQ